MQVLDKSSNLSNPDGKRTEKTIAADLCYRLAKIYGSKKDHKRAQQYYNEALKQDEGHEGSRLALVSSRQHPAALTRVPLSTCL